MPTLGKRRADPAVLSSHPRASPGKSDSFRSHRLNNLSLLSSKVHIFPIDSKSRHLRVNLGKIITIITLVKFRNQDTNCRVLRKMTNANIIRTVGTAANQLVPAATAHKARVPYPGRAGGASGSRDWVCVSVGARASSRR